MHFCASTSSLHWLSSNWLSVSCFCSTGFLDDTISSRYRLPVFNILQLKFLNTVFTTEKLVDNHHQGLLFEYACI